MKGSLLIFAVGLLAIASAMTTEQHINTLQEDITMLMEKKGYTVNAVMKLLEDLRDTERDDLAKLIAAWKTRSAELIVSIKAEKKLLKEKTEECDTIEKFIKYQIRERSITEKNIITATLKVKKNNEHLRKREETRCANNLHFLNAVAKSRQYVKFLEYLKKEISESSFTKYLATQSQAMVELSDTLEGMDAIDAINAVTAHHLMAQLSEHMEADETETDSETKPLSDKQMDKIYNADKRTKKEIGTGHIDANKKALKIKTDYGFDGTGAVIMVKRLIALIEGMIKTIKEDLEKASEREASLVKAFLKFKKTMELQNHVIIMQIRAWKIFVEKVVDSVKQNRVVLVKCRATQKGIHKTLLQFKATYRREAVQFRASKKKNQNTIRIINLAIRVYRKTVASAKQVYKNRVKDYAADQNFDKVKFENRKNNKSIKNFNPKKKALIQTAATTTETKNPSLLQLRQRFSQTKTQHTKNLHSVIANNGKIVRKTKANL